jgi:endonuclease YncB( thermonuclease family)
MGHIGLGLGCLHLSTRTNYGRLLNEWILRAGYANLLTHPSNLKYEERFLKAYREAYENGRGFWRSK